MARGGQGWCVTLKANLLPRLGAIKKKPVLGTPGFPMESVKWGLEMFCEGARERESCCCGFGCSSSAHPGFYVAAESGGGNKVVPCSEPRSMALPVIWELG